MFCLLFSVYSRPVQTGERILLDRNVRAAAVAVNWVQMVIRGVGQQAVLPSSRAYYHIPLTDADQICNWCCQDAQARPLVMSLATIIAITLCFYIHGGVDVCGILYMRLAAAVNAIG